MSESKVPSNVVDLDCALPGANMYGCQPCPKCGQPFRYQTNDGPAIHCDDCGFEEDGVDAPPFESTPNR